MEVLFTFNKCGNFFRSKLGLDLFLRMTNANDCLSLYLSCSHRYFFAYICIFTHTYIKMILRISKWIKEAFLHIKHFIHVINKWCFLLIELFIQNLPKLLFKNNKLGIYSEYNSKKLLNISKRIKYAFRHIQNFIY